MSAMTFEIWSGGHGERCHRMKGHGRGRGRGQRMSEAAGYGFLGRGPRAGRGDIRAAILRLPPPPLCGPFPPQTEEEQAAPASNPNRRS